MQDANHDELVSDEKIFIVISDFSSALAHLKSLKQEDSIDTLSLALKVNVEITKQVDSSGCSLLHHAAESGRIDVCEFLVSIGIKSGLR